jgi:hypothetical protein
MHLTVRRYRNWTGPVGEVARRAALSLVPELQRQPGFRLYCAFESAEGDAVSVNLVEQREQAIAANAQILRWVRTEAADLIHHLPETMMGACPVWAVSQPAAWAGSPHVTVRQHHGLAAEDAVMPEVRTHILPLISRAPGFRAFFASMNAHHRGQGIGVTLFEDAASAAESNERAVSAMLAKGIAPYPPQVWAGKALVMTVAGEAWPDPADDPAA